MKIIQLLPELNEGGVERGVVELSKELVKQQFISIVISNGGKLVHQIEEDGGIHILFDICSKNPFTAPIRILRLRKILQKLKPDILHVRSRVPAWIVYFANKSLNIKVISTVHGFNSISKYSEIMTQADKIICVSNSIKEYIQLNYKIPENKTTVIPRGINLEKFNPTNLDQTFIKEFKDQFNLHNRFIITTVGRITQLKSLETFIHAIYLVQKQKPNALGLIVGGVRHDKQEYFKSLQTLIKSLNVNVIFTGSQNNVAEIYALSDVVISASKKPESFGRSVAEAIALNTPVIATNHGGVKDIILNGENGYLVSINDFKTLSQKILIANNLKFDGFNYIKNKFSLDKMVTKTIFEYKDLKERTSVCLVLLTKTSKNLGGLEKHFVDLTNGLANSGFKVSVITHKSFNKFFLSNINCINIQPSSRYNILFILKIYSILKKNNFDIVHTHANKSTQIMSLIKSFFYKTKFIATLHNKKNEISYYKKMDYIIAVSNKVAQQFNQSNVKVIYNGINFTSPKDNEKINLYQEFSIKNNFPILLSIGRLVKAKGFESLISAVSSLDINIIIVGDGPLYNKLNNLVKVKNLNNKVFFAFHRSDVPLLIKSSDGVIIASTHEGFSYVFAETLLLRKPLLSTDVADIATFVPKNLLCNPNSIKGLESIIKNFLQAIPEEQLLSSYELAEKELTLNSMILNTINLYKKVLNENK